MFSTADTDMTTSDQTSSTSISVFLVKLLVVQISMGLSIFSKEVEVDMEGPVAKLVTDFISSDNIVIFSKTYCPYCKMAKDVFDSINKKYTTIELDKRDDANEIQAVLGQITGAKTVPRVFVNGKCIGGGSDVKQLHQNGALLPLLD